MKRILPLLLVILLAACAPALPKTSEVSETSEVLPATATVEVTVTPEATATPIPTSTPEIQSALEPAAMMADPYNFTAEQVATYDKIEKITGVFNNKNVPMIVGMGKSGERVVLAMEVTNWKGERVMQRTSVTTDPDTGVQYAVFVNSEFDAGEAGGNPARIMIDVNGAEVLFMDPKYGLFANLARPNGGQYGELGEKQLREFVAAQLRLGSGLPLKILVQPENPPAGDTASMEWIESPVKANLSLPMELVFPATDVEFAQLPAEVQQRFMIGRDPGEVKSGMLLWVAEDGHLQMFVADSVFFTNGGHSIDLERQERATKQRFANGIIRVLWVFSRQRNETRSGLALNDSSVEFSSKELESVDEGVFDFQIK